MKIQSLNTREVFDSLRSGTDGLSEPEAERRLREFLPNRIERLVRVPWWRRLLSGLSNFLAIVLWLAAGLAFFAETTEPGEGMATLGMAIVGVIFLNALFSFWQEYRAERAILALEKLMPNTVRAVRQGQVRELDRTELVPGDLIVLAAGDEVPADCRLVEAFDVRLNNATLTGESYPVGRDSEPTDTSDLAHCRNILLAGSALLSGEGRAVVFATGMHTVFGQIAHLTQTGGEVDSPLHREIKRLSRFIGGLALFMGAFFFGLGEWIGLSLWNSLLFGIGIIVANVPEGLLPTVTLSLAMAAQRMAAKSALVRHLPSVETLGSATVICTDKTGTLTENRMHARAGYWDETEIDLNVDGVRIPAALQGGAALCHNLQPGQIDGQAMLVGDPLEQALVAMAVRAGPALPTAPRVDQIPFNAERRMFSTLHDTEAGLVLYSKGALDALLLHSTDVEVKGEVLALTDEQRRLFRVAEQSLADRGLRVIAFGYRPVQKDYDRSDLESGLRLVGLVGLEDPIRHEVPLAISRCREAGVRVVMVTGDHPRTAAAVARDIGLAREQPMVITGTQLAAMSPSQLRLALDAPELILARVNPEQKLLIVKTLQEKGETVAVTGDGVNDAPALRQADIGIAMGKSGTDVARAAADVVLVDDNFVSIVAAIEEGRTIFQNIRRFITYVLTHNVPEIIPYLAFVLFRIPLPLTVVQILAIDLGTDVVPALGLGAERPDAAVMQSPPRPRHQRLLDRPLLARAYLFLGPVEAIAALAAFFYVLQQGGWHYGQSLVGHDPLYLRATTATLTTIVVMQSVNVFLCRSESGFARGRGFFANRLVLLGVGLALLLILVVDYTPFGNLLLGTAPLSLDVWFFIVPFAFAMVLLEGLRKYERLRRKT